MSDKGAREQRGRPHSGIPGGIVPFNPGGFVGYVTRRGIGVLDRGRTRPSITCRLANSGAHLRSDHPVEACLPCFVTPPLRSQVAVRGETTRGQDIRESMSRNGAWYELQVESDVSCRRQQGDFGAGEATDLARDAARRLGRRFADYRRIRTIREGSDRRYRLPRRRSSPGRKCTCCGDWLGQADILADPRQKIY